METTHTDTNTAAEISAYMSGQICAELIRTRAGLAVADETLTAFMLNHLDSFTTSENVDFFNGFADYVESELNADVDGRRAASLILERRVNPDHGLIVGKVGR